MEVVIGSTALELFNYNRKEPADLDIFTDNKERVNSGDDCHYVPTKILSLMSTIEMDGVVYATPDTIYTIKLSHAVYPIHWHKTKLDILWLKSKQCKVIWSLYTELIEWWKQEHGNKEFLSLNKNKDSFFDDAVECPIDHDYLHELVAYPNKPVYTKCLKDNEEVLIDKIKFDRMSFEDQVRMFREEIAVIALERWKLNPNIKRRISWYQAYMFSLEKTVTRLTKGWASRFIVENLDYFIKPDYTYFKHAIETLNIER